MTTTATPLSERIIPARRAARRASAVFAEQVQTSPGRSDDEPEPSDSFGEPPSRRQPNVKYRYNAKGKFRASPLKQTDSPSPSPKRKAKPKRNRKPKPMTPSHPQPSMPSRKRRASPSFSGREGTASTLTTLSPSPFPDPSTSMILDTPSKVLPSTPLQRPGTRTGSMRSIGASSSKGASLSKSLSQASLRKNKAHKSKTPSQFNGYHFGDVDSLVWVLVNDFGVIISMVTHDDDDISFLENQMWWPARIVQKEPLRVKLFGDMAPSQEPSTILSPSERNIVPIHTLSGEKRFSSTTFQVSSIRTLDSSNPSPRKKVKTDICERWEAAVKAMESAAELKRDGMPEMISAYAGDTCSSEDEDIEEIRAAPQSLSRSGKRHSAKSKANHNDEDKGEANVAPCDRSEVPTDRAWSPPPPDPTLQLPGELVLAQAPRTRGNKYWPAQLISYVSPAKPGGKQRYRAKFLDDQEYDLPRDKFWTSEERGFITCDMGEFESAVQDAEAPDSENEQDGVENIERSPSPQLVDPPPAADDFEDLPMRAQLAYVMPILKAILRGQYAPAIKKHEAFMRGGVARSSLTKRAAMRGGLDPNEVKQLQRLIARWALGEGYARKVDGGSEPPVPLPERETVLAVNGDGLADVAPSNLDCDSSSQLIPPNGNIGNCVDGMTVDGPNQFGGSKGPETGELPSAQLQDNEATAALTADCDGLAAGILATSDSVMSQPIPLSDIRNHADGDPMTINQKAGELLHENTCSATNLIAETLTNVDVGKTDERSESAGDDRKSQHIPLSDIRHRVDDDDAMVIDMPIQADKPLELETNGLSLPPASKEDVTVQSDSCANPEIPHDQPHSMGLQEYESLSTLDKLDYCVNILLPEAIQQLLLWRSGERTSAALLPAEEEERLHERGETKAQETDWVYDLLRLREAQARLLGVDLKAKNKEKKKGSDVKAGGTRSRPSKATVSR